MVENNQRPACLKDFCPYPRNNFNIYKYRIWVHHVVNSSFIDFAFWFYFPFIYVSEGKTWSTEVSSSARNNFKLVSPSKWKRGLYNHARDYLLSKLITTHFSSLFSPNPKNLFKQIKWLNTYACCFIFYDGI